MEHSVLGSRFVDFYPRGMAVSRMTSLVDFVEKRREMFANNVERHIERGYSSLKRNDSSSDRTLGKSRFIVLDFAEKSSPCRMKTCLSAVHRKICSILFRVI